MFSDLPKLFDRDFAIGYFLPVACFLASFYGVLTVFHHRQLVTPFKQSNILIGTTMLALITWLIGVFLLSVNRKLYQLFSGYPLFDGHEWPAWTKRIEIRRFWNLWETLEALQQENIDSAVGKDIKKLTRKRSKIQTRLAERFPEKASLISPTEFGNTISAFELYPKVMYGIDAIEGWARLLAVIPKEYRSFIDAAKAQTDFWLNLTFLSGLVFLSYLGFAIHDRHCNAVWLPFLVLTTCYLAYRASITAAKDWGIAFKAAFDVFLPDLYVKLRFSLPADAASEWKTWDNFSRAIIFRSPSSLPPRTQWNESEREEQAGEDHEPEEKSNNESKEAGDEAEESNNAVSTMDQSSAEALSQPEVSS